MSDAIQFHHPGDGSTGPQTPEGKQHSSRNALVHGGRSEKHFILPTELETDYETSRQRWLNEFRPKSELESELLERLAERDWAFQRWQRLFDQAEYKLLLVQPDPALWDDRGHRHLQLMLRYRVAAERAYRAAWKDVEAYRLNRVYEALALEKLKHSYYVNYKNGIRDKKPANAQPPATQAPPSPPPKPVPRKQAGSGPGVTPDAELTPERAPNERPGQA